jgi:predicted nucleic acid-binding protein
MRIFFDSNVAVYALAADDPLRSPAAQRLLAYPEPGCTLVLSTQVLMETYNVLTRKKRADPAAVLAGLRLLARFEVLAPSAQAVLMALDLAARHGLNAWDALIVQAAIEGGCERLYSEDLQNGRHFGALEVVNPFLHLGQARSSPPPAPTRSAPSAGKSRKTRPSSPAR